MDNKKHSFKKLGDIRSMLENTPFSKPITEIKPVKSAPKMADAQGKVDWEKEAQYNPPVMTADEIEDAKINYAKRLIKYGAQQGVKDPNILGAMLASVQAESGFDNRKRENVNYTAENVVNLWPDRFGVGIHDPAKESLESYEKRKGQQIAKIKNEITNKGARHTANTVYGNRTMNRGTNDPDKGVKYRGTGGLQLTGYQNFAKMQEYINRKTGETYDLINNPTLLTTDPELDAMATVGYFAQQTQNKWKNYTPEQIVRMVGYAGDKDGEKTASRLQKAQEYANLMKNLMDNKSNLADGSLLKMMSGGK